MALWVDGSAPSLEDLQAYESGVYAMSSAEGIDLAEKIRLSQQEITTELEEFIADLGGAGGQKFTIEQVVITEPLRRWATLRALALAYRDAHYNQSSERYKGRWQEYSGQSNEARWQLWRAGVGVVRAPLRKAAPPLITAVSGNVPAGSYFVRICWVDGQGEMSEASEIKSWTLTATGGFEVSAPTAPVNISGWNVYVGSTADTIRKQNTVVLALTAKWAVTQAGFVQGEPAPTGQTADYLVRQANLLRRG